MKTRKEFPQLLNSLGLVGQGVEVGVAGGSFSSVIRQGWLGEKLWLVDPYKFQNSLLDRSDDEEQHKINFSAIQNFVRQNKGKTELIRNFSIEAAKQFEPHSLDFVYIDAKHDYRSVTQDLVGWYLRVKSGGIVAGHDYKNSCVRKNLVEVKRAVDDFFFRDEIVHTTVDDNLPSWWVIKDSD